MKFYHGTDLDSVDSILGKPNKVDVKKGGGELGRGFYVGNEPTLAKSLAKGRFNDKAAVIKIKILDSDFLSLDELAIKSRKDFVKAITPTLKFRFAKTHLFNVDVVSAPFATIEHSLQYKFESTEAQMIINSSKIKKVFPK